MAEQKAKVVKVGRGGPRAPPRFSAYSSSNAPV